MERLHTSLRASVMLLLSAFGAGFEIKMTRVSTVYLPYAFNGDEPLYEMSKHVMENFAFDPDNKLIYVVGDDLLHILDATNASDLQYLNHIDVADTQFKGVEVCQGHVFVTYVNKANLLQGGLMVYAGYDRHAASMLQVNSVSRGVGSEPGALKATKDCTLVIPGDNRGVFVNGLFNDPPGTVAIIRFPHGFASSLAQTTLTFTQFDSRIENLTRSGVRWVYRGNNGDNPFSNDAEPQQVTFNDDFTKAYVSLQVNNAVAEIDMVNNSITALRGMGFKRWGDLDPSDKDGGINIAAWPIKGMYQPDVIQWVSWKNEGYIVTANEGKSKGYQAVQFDEDKRGSEFAAADISPSVSAELRQALTDESKLGRLVLSAVDGKNPEGKIEEFYSYGGRSFSIYRASDMYQVYDSGSDLEKKTAELRPDIFNADVDKDQRMFSLKDQRSDNSGPEPATVTVGKLGLYLLIFVGMEKPGSIAVYSVLDRMEDAKFQMLYTEGMPTENKTLAALYGERKIFSVEPEWIRFYPDGLADFPALLVGGSACGTISVIRIDVTGETSNAVPLATCSVCKLLLIATALIYMANTT